MTSLGHLFIFMLKVRDALCWCVTLVHNWTNKEIVWYYLIRGRTHNLVLSLIKKGFRHEQDDKQVTEK